MSARSEVALCELQHRVWWRSSSYSFPCSAFYHRKSGDVLPIPEHKLIVSVPCVLHSHKPPLAGTFCLLLDVTGGRWTWVSERMPLERGAFIGEVPQFPTCQAVLLTRTCSSSAFPKMLSGTRVSVSKGEYEQ